MQKLIKEIILITSIAFASILLCNSVHAQDIKPIKGTWVNLPYQDVRNKYMNPAHVNYQSGSFWEMKVNELADIGMEYIVIMAVANDQKAFYPSGFMPPAYPLEEVSPVEAIMSTSEKRGLKVFMSCGWAVDQDDDIRRIEVKEIQKKIMEETAALYGDYTSFFGWYLPVEDSLDPYLPDQSVEAVNILTAKAKDLTPDAKVMISPYGIWNADIDNPRFAEQIKKLKVDIIAYQDEVGCVRELLPIPRMKENFKKLGEIHKGTDISFWSNVESFTWEKEPNSRTSALIPAAFSRYLSQIVGATVSGASEVVSFSIYGIIDPPTSPCPIGQPIKSVQAYLDFSDWKNHKGRWKLLEKTFISDLSHQGIYGKIKYISKPAAKFNQGNLIDGRFGNEDYRTKQWVGFDKGKMEVIIDLTNKIAINTIAARFMHYRPQQISLPQNVDFYVSDDGKKYHKLKSIQFDKNLNDLHDCFIDIAAVEKLNVAGRFIKIVAEQDAAHLILCDEIIINP